MACHGSYGHSWDDLPTQNAGFRPVRHPAQVMQRPGGDHRHKALVWSGGVLYPPNGRPAFEETVELDAI